MIARVMKRSQESGRSDDNIEVLKKRFTTHMNDTQPIIDYYDKQQKVLKIDTERDVDVIFTELEHKLKFD
jgi:UMP-CMP kinase